MSEFLLDPETARYLVDQILVRLDVVTWFIVWLAGAIVLRVGVRPVIDFIHQVELSTVTLIKVWRNK